MKASDLIPVSVTVKEVYIGADGKEYPTAEAASESLLDAQLRPFFDFWGITSGTTRAAVITAILSEQFPYTLVAKEPNNAQA